MNTNHPHSKENGSVLLWILVAVVLLAGLTAAMNQGSRTSSSQLSDQQARVVATEILSYLNTVRSSVQRMQMRGISEGDFDFSTDIFKTHAGTPITTSNSSCTSDQCKLYHPSGGGVTPSIVAKEAQIVHASPVPAMWQSGHSGFRIMQVEGVGSELPDIVMLTAFISGPVCKAINEMVGVSNPNGKPPVFETNSIINEYTGTITSLPNSLSPVDHSALKGKMTFCNEEAADSGSYFLHAVVIAR